MVFFPISYRTFLSDAPDRSVPDTNPLHLRRLMWELSIMVLGYHNYNETFIQPNKNMPLKECLQEYWGIDKMWGSFLQD